MKKNWILNIENGLTGGRIKAFYSFSSCIKYAIKHINDDSWIYIDNFQIKELNRLYVKVPHKNGGEGANYLEEKVIIK